MLEEADYKKKLQETLEKIKDYFDIFGIRGSDVSCFIFAKKTILQLRFIKAKTL